MLEMRADALLRQKRRLVAVPSLSPGGEDSSSSSSRVNQSLLCRDGIKDTTTQRDEFFRLRRDALEEKLAIDRQVAGCYKLVKETRADEIARLSKSFLRSNLRKVGCDGDLMRNLRAILGKLSWGLIR